MGKKAAGVTTPISSRELELICKARHIAGKLEGLREAAEIARPKTLRGCDCANCDCHNVNDAQFVAAYDAEKGVEAAILARIAELEGQKP